MSGLVKSVKKVFKKAVKVVKKVLPYVAMAAAIYFTAGIAAAAFAPASAMAAMPGIAGAASALGIGGGAAGAAAAGASTAAAAAPTFSGVAAGLSSGGTMFSATGAALSAGSAAAASAGIGAAAATAGAATAAVKTGFAAMSFADKLTLASVGTQALGTLVEPSTKSMIRDEMIETKKWRGAFYGMDESGAGFDAVDAPKFGRFEEALKPKEPGPDSMSRFSESLSETMMPPKIGAGREAEFDLFAGLSQGGPTTSRLRNGRT